MSVSQDLFYYLGGGLLAARPDGSQFPTGGVGFYFATDLSGGTMTYWNGTAWGVFTASSVTVISPATVTNTKSQ